MITRFIAHHLKQTLRRVAQTLLVRCIFDFIRQLDVRTARRTLTRGHIFVMAGTVRNQMCIVDSRNCQRRVSYCLLDQILGKWSDIHSDTEVVDRTY